MDRIITKEEIQRLVELSKKATQGKWAIDARYSNHAEIRSHRLYAGAYERLVADTFSQSLYAQDAEFIAALVNWFRANHQSLSQESVRSEALEEAAKVCESMIFDEPDNIRAFDNGCRTCADAIRALHSPARVAEGGKYVRR